MMSSFGASTGGGDDEDEGAGKAKTPEEIFSEIAADIVARCPDSFDLGAAERAYPVVREQCLNVVLLMELGKFNRLQGKIKGTCVDLQKAVKGLVVFSPDLEQVAEGALTNKIPDPW